MGIEGGFEKHTVPLRRRPCLRQAGLPAQAGFGLPWLSKDSRYEEAEKSNCRRTCNR